MKNRSFSHRAPYYFKPSIHVRKPVMMLKLIRLPLNASELKPILRWEDDGGQMTDTTVALQSSQEYAGQSEKNTALAYDPILDPFHTKQLRIQL